MTANINWFWVKQGGVSKTINANLLDARNVYCHLPSAKYVRTEGESTCRIDTISQTTSVCRVLTPYFLGASSIAVKNNNH